jgi:hypothetical protein
VCAGLAETVLFLLAVLVVHSAIAFPFLHMTGRTLDDRTFWTIAFASAALCAWLVRGHRIEPFPITSVPPLALLLIVLLRAKLPDGAFDSLLYKSTIPLLIADWRTSLTGVFDHNLLGTSFSEVMVAQLRILDPAYPPALTSTLAFMALWIVAPLAARGAFDRRWGEARDFACNAAALLMVSITEPLLAAGTAYHEPMLSLLMAAFLAPLPLAWLFLGAALAAKATVLFAAPVLVAVKLAGWRGGPRPSPALLAAGLALAVVIPAEQVWRNFGETARLSGSAEILAGFTDSGNQVLSARNASWAPPVEPRPGEPPASLPPVPQSHDAAARPGFAERTARTLVHMLTLDRWIVPTEYDFHFLPSSRLAPWPSCWRGACWLSRRSGARQDPGSSRSTPSSRRACSP